jgi:hypothetical protein
MAQDFTRSIARNIGTSASTLRTADSNDSVIGIRLANVVATQILVDVYVTSGGNDYYLIKQVPIPAGSSLELLDGGAKFVLASGDALKVVSDTATSCDAWVSIIDTVSV